MKKKLLTGFLTAVLVLSCLFSLGGCLLEKGGITITFDADGGTRVGGGELVQTIDNINQLNEPVLEKEGYVFSGWSKILLEITQTTTVTAIWTKEQISVSFEVSGGDHVSGNIVQQVHYGTELIPPVFVKEGYTLVWDKVLADVLTSTIITGSWVANTYTLSFTDEGETIVGCDDMQIEYDSNVERMPVPEKPGYNFLGWKNTETEQIISEGQKWTIADDVVVEATWSTEHYAINYNLNGGNQTQNPNGYTIEQPVVIDAAQRVGYNFIGWVETDSEWNELQDQTPRTTFIVNEDYDTTGNLYFKAVWVVNTYTLSFIDEGEAIVGCDDMQIEYDTNVVGMPIPEKPGHNFLGWKNTETEEIINEGQKWTIADDVVVEATWSTEHYAINYNLDGGNQTQNPNGYTIEQPVVINAAQRVGYNFIGWVATNEQWEALPDQTPRTTFIVNEDYDTTGNLYFKAVWVVNTYTLSFIDEGETIVGCDDMQIEYDSNVERMPVPEKPGYNFLGWKNTETEQIISEGQKWTIADDVVVEATWSTEHYAINYNLNGGNQTQNPNGYTIEQPVVINAAQRVGYNFIGWVATNEQWEALPDQTPRTTFIVNEDYDTTGNLYFKALWDAKKYTVSFKSSEGTVSATTKIFTYDETVGELPEVSGNSNKFVGWYYGSQKVSVGDKWDIDQSVVELTAVFKKVFQINLHLEQEMKDGKTVKFRLGTGQSATIEVLSDQQIILPVPTSLDTEEYAFSCWKYKDKDGKLVKLESGTVAKMQNFPNVVDTGGMIVLDVYVISRALWTPFY